jgi:drug/metabolite transporter (DMT)-like permease
MALTSDKGAVLRGIAWMGLAMSCIGIIDGMAKYLAQTLNGVQVAWSYFGAMLANLLIVVLVTRARRRLVALSDLVRARRVALQLWRAGSLVLSLSCLFLSLSYLELAEATVVSFTAPLFIVALAGPVLSEQVSWQRWLAVCLGLLGAVIVVRPGTGVFQWAALLPLAGAVFFAFFHMITRIIGTADPPLTTLFYTICGGTLMLSAAMPAVWSPMTGLEVGIAFLSGSLGLLAHGALVRALSLADASALAPMNYVRLVWAIGIGYVVFAEVPDAFTIFGGTVIVGSGLYVVHSAATRPH